MRARRCVAQMLDHASWVGMERDTSESLLVHRLSEFEGDASVSRLFDGRCHRTRLPNFERSASNAVTAARCLLSALHALMSSASCGMSDRRRSTARLDQHQGFLQGDPTVGLLKGFAVAVGRLPLGRSGLALVVIHRVDDSFGPFS